MGIAALVSWAATAAFGLLLSGTWMARGGLGRRGRFGSVRELPPAYIPAPLIAAHGSLAAGGLVVWVMYLIAGLEALAWVALGLLLPVGLLGASMFLRWLGSRRTRPIAPLLAEEAAAAEARLPVAMVVSHGLLAFTTLTLVFLTAVGVRGS